MARTTHRRGTALAAALLTACATTALVPAGAQAHRDAASSVSAPRLKFPSGPARATVVSPGSQPGEVNFKVRTEGLNTDYFKITTATTGFKDGARDKKVFKFPFHRKAGVNNYTFTLTAAQTKAAGAGVGTAWTLVWQIEAINAANGKTQDRYFGQGQVRVPGKAAEGTNPIRVASYNVRNDSTFAKRAKLIGANILSHEPGIVTIQELFKFAVADFKDGLEDAGNSGRYVLTRESNVDAGGKNERTMQARILYDTDRYAMVSNCPDVNTDVTCVIPFEADGGDTDFALWARFKDLVNNQEFYVVSFHLPHGPYDALRAQEMETITDYVNDNFEDGVPVILGGDTNSSQLRPGKRPHDVMMAKGYYDSASTVTHVNAAYGTANDYEYQKPSGFRPSPRIDVIATRDMPGSDRFENVLVEKPDPFPSDHNMIIAELALP